MTCKALVLAALLAGCTDDIPEVQLTTSALTPTTLGSVDDVIPESLAHYRWTLISAPRDANATAPSDDAAVVVVTPPVRGLYAYERWLEHGLSEDVSLRVILTVSGVPPVAKLTPTPQVSVGDRATLVGNGSYSDEQRPLTYVWRLARRPAASTASLADTTKAVATLTPDVPGDYDVELRVFDGELWSSRVGHTMRVVP
jgi:hypothetical protein